MKSHVLIAMKPVYYLHTAVFDIFGAAAEISKTFLHATEINLNQFVFHFGKATLFLLALIMCSTVSYLFSILSLFMFAVVNVANTALCTRIHSL